MLVTAALSALHDNAAEVRAEKTLIVSQRVTAPRSGHGTGAGQSPIGAGLALDLPFSTIGCSGLEHSSVR